MKEEEFLQNQSNFWNHISGGWSLQNKNPVVGWYHEHQAFKEYETELFRGLDTKGKLAFEYGCGPGRNMIRFKDWFDRVDGCDIAPDCIDKAKINLEDAGIAIPNLWANDGKSIPMIADETYDVIFSVICMQHITSRNVRINLYKEFFRALKPGGSFCFQMGFGSGHPRSVDYFQSDYDSFSEVHNKDTRVENVDALQTDVCSVGFKNFSHTLTGTCHDEHPQWIWVQVQK